MSLLNPLCSYQTKQRAKYFNTSSEPLDAVVILQCSCSFLCRGSSSTSSSRSPRTNLCVLPGIHHGSPHFIREMIHQAKGKGGEVHVKPALVMAAHRILGSKLVAVPPGDARKSPGSQWANLSVRKNSCPKER